MRKFIKHIFYFVLPILILAYPLDVLISSQLKKSRTFAFGELTTWNDLYNGRVSADLVIYGSSRAWVHFDPKIFESELGLPTYNLGIDGHNFWLQYYRHQLLMKLNKKPTTIIQSIDVFTLQKREKLFNKRQFLPYMLFNPELKEFTKTYKGYSTFDYYIPLYRYFGNSKALNETIYTTFSNNRKSDKGRIQGYKGNEGPWIGNLKEDKVKWSGYEANIDQQSLELFIQFLEECKSEGINVILVYSPVYIEGQNFIKNTNEIISLFETIARDRNIEFMNYSNSEIAENKKLFYNVLHLNKTGAELFSKELVKDLKLMNDEF